VYWKDTWQGMIPEDKRRAYKKLIDSGDIQVKQVTVHMTIDVEYEADEGIRQKLKEASQSE